MQKVTRDQLIAKASELLSGGTVSAVLGWGKGEFAYDVTPTVFTTVDQLQEGFVWSDFCGANFAKYLVSKTQKIEGKILVFLKPCDTYSFNQLLSEHRVDREKAYIIGVGCKGKLSIEKVKAAGIKGILSVTDTDPLQVETLYGNTTVAYTDAMLDLWSEHFDATTKPQGMTKAKFKIVKQPEVRIHHAFLFSDIHVGYQALAEILPLFSVFAYTRNCTNFVKGTR